MWILYFYQNNYFRKFNGTSDLINYHNWYLNFKQPVLLFIKKGFTYLANVNDIHVIQKKIKTYRTFIYSQKLKLH